MLLLIQVMDFQDDYANMAVVVRHTAQREPVVEALEAIYGRHAIREYAPEMPATETIQSLVKAAVQAPSAMNLQPWAFAVVRGRDRLVSISDRAKGHLVKTMAAGSPLSSLRERLADPSFDIFYGAPVLIIICATSSEAGASEDCALAAQNLMLAAHSEGLGTCWIGLARPWLNEATAKEELRLPTSYAPVAPIILGYPKGEPEIHPRQHPEIVWIGE
jgi:nitroreductase